MHPEDDCLKLKEYYLNYCRKEVGKFETVGVYETRDNDDLWHIEGGHCQNVGHGGCWVLAH